MDDTATLPDAQTQLAEALANSSHGGQLQHLITISITDGACVLEGRVPTFYLKQMCQTAIADLCTAFGFQIQNDVHVQNR